MFRRQRAVSVCLALAFLGLAVLFLHAKSITPRAIAISDIGGDDVGTPVRVQGHVHRVSTTDEGNAAIVLIDYNDFATVRVVARPRAIAEPTLVSPGALVEVVGSVFGAGTIQLFSEDEGGVTVRAPASSNRLPLEFVARNAARLSGHRVGVRAELADVQASIDPRHALVRDQDAEMWAFAADGWSGGRQDVTGRLAVTSLGRCELFAGEEPEAVHVTLAALAACPEALLDRPVRVSNVTVDPGESIGTHLTVSDVGEGARYRMAAFVRGWDWRRGTPVVRLGDLVTVLGDVEYQATEARWRIVCENPPGR